MHTRSQPFISKKIFFSFFFYDIYGHYEIRKNTSTNNSNHKDDDDADYDFRKAKQIEVLKKKQKKNKKSEKTGYESL